MLEIKGWVWLGVIIGFVVGYITRTLFDRTSNDIEQEIQHLIITRDALKEDINGLGNKPKPRSKRKRNVKQQKSIS